MIFIRVTALPNADHQDNATRQTFLLNLDKVACFKGAPDELVAVWFDWDGDTPCIEVAESLDEIEQQIQLQTRPLVTDMERQIALIGRRTGVLP